MEPTIRKGEQSPEEQPQPEEITYEDIPDQVVPAPTVDEDFFSEEIQPLPVDEYAGSSPEVLGQTSDDTVLQSTGDVLPEPQAEQLTELLQNMPQEWSGSILSEQADQVQASIENYPSEAVEPGAMEQDTSVSVYPTSETPAPEYPFSINPVSENPPSENAFPENPISENPLFENPLPENPLPEYTTDFLPLPTAEEGSPPTRTGKVALVLSGGGARGAFQVGAEKYAREAKGYHWDIIAGVSVGALNGAMLAMHRYARLLEIWQTITDQQVYTGGFNLLSFVKIIFGARSFYGNRPLRKLMEGEFAAGRIIEDLRVGTVSLSNGEYVQFTKESLELSKAILASASIPVVWPPVDVSPEYPAMVDGGVRNITPIGDVLSLEPDEIVIINCGNAIPAIAPNASANVLSIGLRTLDIMENEIFANDMKQFLLINALVKEAEQQGSVLHHPKSGRPYKYYPCQVIEPDVELGGVLDFSQVSVQASLRAGVRRAREVLGRH